MSGRCCALVPLLALALSQPAKAETPRVTSVRLVGVETERERLGRYVTIAVGQPLDAKDVRATVERLFALGRFDDVRVEAEPSPRGVDVAIHLVPVPRMTAVRVAGDRLLSEKQARRLARLAPGEALYEARLEEIGRSLAVALAARGYLESRVDAAAEAGPRGVTAVLTIKAGPHAVVDSVSVDPLPGVSSLLPLAAPRSGAPFQKARAENAAEAMRRQLVASGRWRAAVHVRETYDPRTARVALRFEVTPGPMLSLAFRGSTLPRGLRSSVERLVREAGARTDALEEAADLIEARLRAAGHREPRVRHAETARADTLEISYEVAAGEASRVASVSSGGVEPPSPLLTRVGEPVQDSRLEEDAQGLQRSLQRDGMSEAKVEPDAPEGGGDVAVVFRARPGPRTLVASVIVDSPVTDLPRPALSTVPGAPYRVSALARDKAALLQSYRDAGYLAVEVEPRVEFAAEKTEAQVVFSVQPGPLTRVGEIMVAGLETTRENVARRELSFKPGDPLSPTQLLESQRRLQALGIFERVQVEEIASEDGARHDIVVRVQEAPRKAVWYGLGYAERDLLRASVEVTLKNLSGMDRSLSSFARMSFRSSRLFATYREPRLFGRKQDLYLTGFREEQQRDGFDYIRYGGLVQTARPLSTRLTLIGRLAYQRTYVFNVTVPIDDIDRQFRTSTFAGPSSSLVYDSRNDPIDPKRGRFVSADVSLSTRALGGDTYLKGFLQSANFTPLGSRLVLGVSGRLGLARTFADEPPRLPLPDRFFAGGDYSMRGFKIDFVGPVEFSESGEPVPTGGNAVLTGSVELRFALRPRIELAAFSDIGNVYALASDLTLSDLRYTAGLGIRYKSSIGPLRVDWGRKLDRRAGESAYHVHVTVGHAF